MRNNLEHTDADLGEVVIPWAVNNLDKLSDEQLISCLTMSHLHINGNETKLNFYNHPRLMRLRLSLSLASAAKMTNLSIQTVNQLETKGADGISAATIDIYLARLKTMVHRCERFIEVNHVKNLKDIFKKAYELFEDTPQVIPYILMECVFRQTFIEVYDPPKAESMHKHLPHEEFLKMLSELD